MNEALAAALPWLPASVLPVLLLLAAPLCGSRGRTRIAALLGLGALAALVAAGLEAEATRALDVANAFPKGPGGAMTMLVFEHVEAPGWQWGAVAAGWLAAAAAGTFVTRGITRPAGLVVHPLFVGVWLLGARLTLEKSAAPADLVWATGLSIAIVPFVVMQGLTAARTGRSFRQLAVALLVLAVLQRALVCAVAYWLTTGHLGTHLDFTPLTGFESRFLPEPVVFGDDVVEKWRAACLIPQLLMWAPGQVVIGLVLGGLTWRVGRRRA